MELSWRQLVGGATLLAALIGIPIGVMQWHYAAIAEVRAQDAAKLDAAERDKEDMRADRDRYYEYLRSQPGTIPAMEEQIKQGEIKNEELERQLQQKGAEPEDKFTNSQTIDVGDSYIDKRTGLILGLISIDNPDFKQEFIAKISLTLPNKERIIVENITTGKSWEFIDSNRKYRLVITGVNWYGSYIDFTIESES